MNSKVSAKPRLLADWVRLAERAGWEVKSTGSGHLKWIPPTGSHVITGRTMRHGHALRNAQQQLRAAGLKI